MSNTASNSSKSTFMLDARVVLNLKQTGQPDRAIHFAEDDLSTMMSEIFPDILDAAHDPSCSYGGIRLSDGTELIVRRENDRVEFSTPGDATVHSFSMAEVREMARAFEEAEPTFDVATNANEHDEPDFIEDGVTPTPDPEFISEQEDENPSKHILADHRQYAELAKQTAENAIREARAKRADDRR